MRLLPLLLAGLLPASNALSQPIKRQTSYVKDGSFESVPRSYVGKNGFTAGGWTFGGSATLERNTGGISNTPYGKQFAHMESGANNQPTGTISQTVSGLTTGKSYLLQWRERLWMPPNDNVCTTTITFGSQVIEKDEILSRSHGEVGWEARAITFKPKTSSSALKFKVNCPQTDSPNYGYDIQYDDISIT